MRPVRKEHIGTNAVPSCEWINLTRDPDTGQLAGKLLPGPKTRWPEWRDRCRCFLAGNNAVAGFKSLGRSASAIPALTGLCGDLAPAPANVGGRVACILGKTLAPMLEFSRTDHTKSKRVYVAAVVSIIWLFGSNAIAVGAVLIVMLLERY